MIFPILYTYIRDVEVYCLNFKVMENHVDWNYTTGSTREFIKKTVFSVELLIWEYDERKNKGVS